MLPRLATVSTVIVFSALAFVHVCWAFGGRWGGADAVPSFEGKPTLQPGPAATLVVAALLVTAAALLGLRAGLFAWPSLPTWIPAAGTWAVGAVMLLRFVGDFRYVGVFKRVVGSRFAELDTRIYAPLCLALALGCLVTALSTPVR